MRRLQRQAARCLLIGLRRRICVTILLACAPCACILCAQTVPWSARIADAVVHQPLAANWNSDAGIRLEGLDAAWYASANGDDFRYLERAINTVLAAGEPPATDSLASGLFGSQLLLLYRVTLDPKYFKVAEALRRRLSPACGLAPINQNPASGPASTNCEAQPFLAEYAAVFHEPSDFTPITRTFQEWNRRSASGPERPIDRARQAAVLVDSLSYYPATGPGHAHLQTMLRRIAASFPARTGLFYAAPHSQGEHASPSATCLAVYVLLKGVRLGFLPPSYDAKAMSAWRKIVTQLGPAPALLDPAPLLLAATEADLASSNSLARGETALVDAWFNSQQRQNAAGQQESFHYKWSDLSDSGYSLLGHMLRSYGVVTGVLDSAPTLAKLAHAQFYFIVSPDIPAKNPHPHYMTTQDAAQIADWVRGGGVLILMENDPPNADIAHLNLLADRFGIHFDNVLRHHIIGEQVEDGRIPVAAGGPLFHHPHTLYMKDTCAISLREPAMALLHDRGDVVMATAKFGRGTVFAAVDPWLYNEYTDGRKNASIYGQFDNFSGGQELVRWLVAQVPGQRLEKRTRTAP